jgi:hypothetical protein
MKRLPYAPLTTIASMQSHAQWRLALLICFHIVICCVSLIYVAELYAHLQIVAFDKARLYAAVQNVASFALVFILFIFCRFSFGYFLGFYFCTMALGYVWLVEFSRFHYDHALATVSVFASAAAFVVPALFITSPIKQRFTLTAPALDRLLSLILILAGGILVFGAFYNFKLVGITEIYRFRGELEFPALLRYAIGMMSNALLPFAFACFVTRGNRKRAGIVLLLLLLFYPITLSKLALFAPLWLLILALLSRYFETRTTVVLSLLLPILTGIILAMLFKSEILGYGPFVNYFGTVNFRMIAFPSIALDVYNDFFSTHSLTYFCHISLLKRFVDCPYTDPLSIVMAKAYGLGNFNASLFATEGIASVGLILAPLAVFACGLAISVGNRLSSDLPSRFILLSGGVLPQLFLNVPFTTTLLTNGAAVLALLWYVLPRAMFEQSQTEESRATLESYGLHRRQDF